MNKMQIAGRCWGCRVGGLVAGGLVGAAAILGLRAEVDLVTIDFRNRIPGVLDARVYDFDGITPLEGPLFSAQLVTNSVMPLIGFESFRLLPERLQVRREGDHVVVRWPDLAARRYVLEATTGLQPTASWISIFERSSYGDPEEIISVTNALTSTSTFYRLKRWR